MAAPAEVVEAPKPKAKRALNPLDKVLLFSKYPSLSLSVEKAQRDYVGHNGEHRIQRGRSRQVVFDKHFTFADMREMEDKKLDIKDEEGNVVDTVVLQVGIRNMEGYHRDFFECVRTPGMDPKVMSFDEMIEKAPKNAESLIKQAEERDIYAANAAPLSMLTVIKKCMGFKIAWDAAHKE